MVRPTIWLCANRSVVQQMRGKFPEYHLRMKISELLRLLEKDGWFIVRQRGSHRQLHHGTKPGTVTVAGKLSVDVPSGTLISVLRQAGLRE